MNKTILSIFLCLFFTFYNNASSADDLMMDWQDVKRTIPDATRETVEDCLIEYFGMPAEVISACVQTRLMSGSSSIQPLIPTGSAINSTLLTAAFLAGSIVESQINEAPGGSSGRSQIKFAYETAVDPDCTTYLAEPELYSSCAYATALIAGVDVRDEALPVAVGVCFTSTDLPALLVSTACKNDEGSFLALAGLPVTVVPTPATRPGCVTNESSVLHPEMGISGDSVNLSATACMQ
nr:hypothetical protein [Oceanococcus sp. HetDA_MAG_MS8]